MLGDRWALLVVREVALGVRRFDELRSATGAPRQVLADRLRRLGEAGVIASRDYQLPGRRTRSEYVLADAGLDLLPVLAALSDWAERHLPGAGGGDPDIVYRHVGCGGRVRAALRCECGELVGDRSRDGDPASGRSAGGRLVAQVNRR